MPVLLWLMGLLGGQADPGVRPAPLPLPKPLLVSNFDRGADKYLFRDRHTDLRLMRQVFNTVLISATAFTGGDTDLAAAAVQEGLAPILEFDFKADFGAGRDIAPRIDALIRQIERHRDLVSGIWVADQLNKPGLTPDQIMGYLAATGGVVHKRIPGIPVFADIESWELTCDQPRQAGCASQANSTWRNQVNAFLTRVYRSGHLDGMFIANNLKHNRLDVARRAWATGRALLPPPFLVVARSAELSFPQDSFEASGQDAAALVAAYVQAPMEAGIDGIHLWSWHRPWRNESGVMELRTFLNKDASPNALWDKLAETFRRLTASPRP